MARPIEFNRDDVVEKALILFRKKGYSATSMRDLEHATGLNPGSFYTAFGNKHQFFLHTLKVFYAQIQANVKITLSEATDPIAGIRAIFSQVIACVVADSPAERCCFIVKSALELAMVDSDVQHLVRDHFTQLEHLLDDALRLAMVKGYLARGTDTGPMAKLLLNMLNGLSVEGTLNPQREQLEAMLNLFFQKLFCPNGQCQTPFH